MTEWFVLHLIGIASFTPETSQMKEETVWPTEHVHHGTDPSYMPVWEDIYEYCSSLHRSWIQFSPNAAHLLRYFWIVLLQLGRRIRKLDWKSW